MTLCNIVTVFAETKSVVKSRLHCITVKGQLISKANCQAMNSSKKRTNEFVFTTMRRVFWKKLKSTKRHFAINRPLKNIFFKFRQNATLSAFGLRSTQIGSVMKHAAKSDYSQALTLINHDPSSKRRRLI